MESPRCFSETLAADLLPQRARAAREAALWMMLEEELHSWTALECARQRKKSSLSRQSELLVAGLVRRFVERLVGTFQRNAEELPEPDQAETLAAISRLFALGGPSGRGQA